MTLDPDACVYDAHLYDAHELDADECMYVIHKSMMRGFFVMDKRTDKAILGIGCSTEFH